MIQPLKPGDIVIVDNLSSHKQPVKREIIEATGAALIFSAALQSGLGSHRKAFSNHKLSYDKPRSNPSAAFGTGLEDS
ncbi:hypothetical protein HED50_19590 [Ochrobactrum oryzae]|nr:hypothetical protein [Brucella oryzae]